MSSPKKSETPLFLVLLGTLAFTLSTLPGQSVEQESTGVSFSSEVANVDRDCDLHKQLRSSNEASCRARKRVDGIDEVISGRVVVKIVSGQDRDVNGKLISAQELDISVRTDDGETGSSRHPIRDLRDINRLAQDQFAATAEKSKPRRLARRSDDRRRVGARDDADRCVGKSGRRLQGTAKYNCFADRLERMDDEDAADFYERNIKSELERMVKSDKPADQRRAAALIAKLKGRGGDYVDESLSDLRAFGQMNYQVRSDTRTLRQLMMLPPNDPRRAAIPQLAQRLQMGQLTSTNFFGNRSSQIDGYNWEFDNFDFSSHLQTNLLTYQSQLNNFYSGVVQAHLNTMGNPQNPNFAQNGWQNNPAIGDPRLVRGGTAAVDFNGPVTPFAGNRPGAQAAANTARPQITGNTVQPVQPTAQLSRATNTTGAPAAGTRVIQKR